MSIGTRPSGSEANRAYERFRGSGKATLREDLLALSPLRDDHVANGHGHSGHSHAHDRATTPTTAMPTLGDDGRAHVRATNRQTL
jgi:hypothetical protein